MVQFSVDKYNLKDLNYVFIEIYKIIPFNLDIQNLNQCELEDLLNKYSFLLPKDLKLLELIKNPFYLNEYLKFCKDGEDIDYIGFKQKLWYIRVKKLKPARELYLSTENCTIFQSKTGPVEIKKLIALF